MKIILGSQSQGRKKVLKAMGYAFDVISPDIDEKAIRHEDPIKLTMELSEAKADALLPRIKELALLITSDQVVVHNGTIREKPVDVDEAIMFLISYTYHPAQTVTSVMVINTLTGKSVAGTDTATIYFNRIPMDKIGAYIGTGDPFLQAGGFDHEHPILLPFVRAIEGEPESITGLPKKLTQDLLKFVR